MAQSFSNNPWDRNSKWLFLCLGWFTRNLECFRGQDWKRQIYNSWRQGTILVLFCMGCIRILYQYCRSLLREDSFALQVLETLLDRGLPCQIRLLRTLPQSTRWDIETRASHQIQLWLSILPSYHLREDHWFQLWTPLSADYIPVAANPDQKSVNCCKLLSSAATRKADGRLELWKSWTRHEVARITPHQTQ